MESSAQKLIFATVRRQIKNQQFSKKSIKREKRKLIQERRQVWASLGAEKLHLLAARYSSSVNPTKAALTQIAYVVHRVITAIPNLILAPIAGALGTLGAQWTTSDARALTSLKQRHLLTTLRKLNDQIDALYISKGKQPRKNLDGKPTRGKIAITKGVKEDLKAILSYAQAFPSIHFEKLRHQVERFETFVNMVNTEHAFRNKSPEVPYINPDLEDEL